MKKHRAVLLVAGLITNAISTFIIAPLCLAAIPPLVTYVEEGPRKGFPVLDENSILHKEIDHRGFNYFDELLELNLLAYSIGDDFQDLTNKSKTEFHQRIRETETPLTIEDIKISNEIYRTKDSEKSAFGKSIFAPNSNYNVYYSNRNRNREIYLISGYSGITQLNKTEFAIEELDIPGIISFDSENSVITVTIRGSIGTLACAPDWITNAYSNPIDGSSVIHASFKGKVHGGFGIKLSLFKRSLSKALQKIIGGLNADQKENLRIVVTGHSQGGGLALLTGAWIASELKLQRGIFGLPVEFILPFDRNRVQLYRFSSPRSLADSAAFWHTNRLVGFENDIRHNASTDVVPSLPSKQSGLIKSLSEFYDFGNLAFEDISATPIMEQFWNALLDQFSNRCQQSQQGAKKCAGLLQDCHEAWNNYDIQATLVRGPAVCEAIYNTLSPWLPFLKGLSNPLNGAGEGGAPESGARICGRALVDGVSRVARNYCSEELISILGSLAIKQHSLPFVRHTAAVATGLDTRKIHENRPSHQNLLDQGVEKLKSIHEWAPYKATAYSLGRPLQLLR